MSELPMSELTEEEYAAAIPEWCGARGLKAHVDMMLCWSLVSYAEQRQPKPEYTCADCDLYRKELPQ